MDFEEFHWNMWWLGAALVMKPDLTADEQAKVIEQAQDLKSGIGKLCEHIAKAHTVP